MKYSTIHSGDRVYVCGPMTGLPSLNYPAFNGMAAYVEYLFKCGVVNPAKNFGGDPNLPREAYLREDFSNLTSMCTAMVMLSGWENSQGAIKEYLIGSELKLKMFDHNFNPIKPYNETLKLVKNPKGYALTIWKTIP